MQYNENEIDKILQEYKLSDEEHKELYNTIKRIWTLDKFPVENPIAVIIGGQTGAGKSGIISYSQKMFDDRNAIRFVRIFFMSLKNILNYIQK